MSSHDEYQVLKEHYEEAQSEVERLNIELDLARGEAEAANKRVTELMKEKERRAIEASAFQRAISSYELTYGSGRRGYF